MAPFETEAMSPVKYMGRNKKSASAMHTPMSMEKNVRMLEALTFHFSATHLLILGGASSSSVMATSELRNSACIPSTKDTKKLTTPRRKTTRVHFFRSSGGVMRFASMHSSPLSLRTTVAMPRLPRIMTPWMTACPPM